MKGFWKGSGLIMDNKKVQDEELTLIAKGICFGSAAGIAIGILFSHPALGMTIGAVVGILAAEGKRMIDYMKKV